MLLFKSLAKRFREHNATYPQLNLNPILKLGPEEPLELQYLWSRSAHLVSFRIRQRKRCPSFSANDRAHRRWMRVPSDVLKVSVDVKKC